MSIVNRWAAVAALSAGAAVLGGCGGGGNESGPPDSLHVSPESFKVGHTGACYAGEGPTVFVYGGQPPYKLSNSAPLGMTLDKSRLTYSGEGFVVYLSGACMEAMPITIEDDMGRLSEVLVTNSDQ
ncbi:MAG: hypothetical protein U1F53_18730 [Burkholderiaceae bacterium]